MLPMERTEKRSSADRREILTALRRRIVDGTMAPGSLFPRRVDLSTQFQASSVTIQRVIDELRREGFIHVNGRRATYVSPNPPHLCHYAMVFSSAPAYGNADPWFRFYQALANEAASFRSDDGRKIDIFYSVEAHVDNTTYTSLVAAVRSHRYTGLIFPEQPYAARFGGTPLVEEPGVGRVATASGEVAGFATVAPNGEPFLDRALDYLAGRGRRRIALLAALGDGRAESFPQKLVARGMESRPYWVQTAHLSGAATARSCMHLLMHGGQPQRPDGLIICDDNLVERGTAGLAAAGIRAPQDADVVAHCNFPWPPHSALPVTWLGYDVRKILGACIESIDSQRRGEPQRAQLVDPVFEDELPDGTKASIRVE